MKAEPFGPPGSRFARPSPEKSLRSQTRFAPVGGTALPLTMGDVGVNVPSRTVPALASISAGSPR